ncbi:unnamed protein product, partial [Scytosiphon promiscuus]
GAPELQLVLSSVRGAASLQRESLALRASPHANASGRALQSSAPESFQTRDGLPGVGGLSTEASEEIELDSVFGAREISAKTGQTFRLDSPDRLSSSLGAMWGDRPVRDGEALLSDESELEVAERKRWQEWARHAAEHERQRRIKILEGMDREENRERLARRAWALSAMDEEQRRRGSQEFLLSIQGTNWFQGTISTVDLDYEICCPYSSLGCQHICLRTELDKHLARDCRFNRPESCDSVALVDAGEYEVVCPNTVLGCDHSCSRSALTQHLEHCHFTGPKGEEERAERAKKKEMVLEQVEEERERRVNQGDWQSDSLLHRLLEDQKRRSMIILHKEILDFAGRCQDFQGRRKKALDNLWHRIEDLVCLLWPDAVIFPYGSYASGMMTPDSDIDIVIVFPGDQHEIMDEQPRRRGSHTDSVGGVLSKTHELADHFQQHAIFTSLKVVQAPVPIIRGVALSDSNGGSDDKISFSFDISIDGPTHSGLATSAFTSYLSDHLPNLAPLTMVLKKLLQSKGLNDPFTGGLSSYGIVLMVAFALLQRDHFPPSPVDSGLVQRAGSDFTSTDETDGDQSEAGRPKFLSSITEATSRKDEFSVPPSPGHTDCVPPSPKGSTRQRPTKKKAASSISNRRQRFWQRSSLVETASNGVDEAQASWDRPRQQHWLGSRTARATLVQDFYAGMPAPAPPGRPPGSRNEVCEGCSAASTSEVVPLHGSIPPPPPLPKPASKCASHPMLAPMSPYIMTGEEPVLGELLLDFLHLFGEDFDIEREGFSVRGGGFRFCVHGTPPHPQAGDPIVIEDPLNCMNNVGRSSFGIGQVQRTFFEALTTIKATLVRINTDGREATTHSTHNTGILRHICAAMAAPTD